MYNPLPPNVTIKESRIHGLGLYATEDIRKGVLIGRIHFKSKEPNNPHRTPLGAFGNHSDNPNCDKLLTQEDESWWVVSNKDISSGDEITWKYTLYEIK